MDVLARDVNSWCRIPGSLFASGLVLLPNDPGAPPVTVEYGPLDVGGADRLTLLLGAGATPDHENVLAVEVATATRAGADVSNARVELRQGEHSSMTLSLGDASDGARVRVGVSFAEFRDARAYGSVRLRYALAYDEDPLMLLFNAAGTDKGAESAAGQGVPHCYAGEYYRRFDAIRHDAFNFLEIGLDNCDPPQGAPSMRVWREYFPRADLFGYDINDFAFVEQERTQVFRGDQSSRTDLSRFLDTCYPRSFRIVVDDGSHASSHQQVSFATLFARVEPGGIYVIEDLGWQPYPESPTTLELLRAFTARGSMNSSFITEAEARYLEHAVDAVEICKPNDSEIAFIGKKKEL
jgi:hypothetical protein